MMGSGKSAIGTELARQIRVPFLDSDAEIENAANATIAEIFARDGETFFREKESQVLARLLQSDPCVLSTGGGAFLRPENRDAISREGASLWLDATVDLLWQRVRLKTTRPLLLTDNPRQTLRDLFDARTPHYKKAMMRVQTRSEYSIADMTGQVIKALLAHPDVLTINEANACKSGAQEG
jgi:shikimate kinase